jgi:hypothetical protein
MICIYLKYNTKTMNSTRKKYKNPWSRYNAKLESISSLERRYTIWTATLFQHFSTNIPRSDGNVPLRVWSALREVISTSSTVTSLVTPYSVRWMVPIHFIPLPKQSREVVFTSPTVISITIHRVIWMTTNESVEYSALFGLHRGFFFRMKKIIFWIMAM